MKLIMRLIACVTCTAPALAAADPAPQWHPFTVAQSSYSWSGPYGGAFLGFGTAGSSTVPGCSPTAGGLVEAAPNLADLPTRPAPPVPPGPPPVFRFQLDTCTARHASGAIAGGRFGYNFEPTPGSGPVFGLEGSYQTTRLRSDSEAMVVGEVLHAGSAVSDLGTVQGRLGYALGRVLVFGTAGLAVGSVQLDADSADVAFAGATPTDARSTSTAAVRAGYVAGGGAEYAVTDHLSATIEGLYFDLGRHAVATPDVRANLATNGVLVRAGINYHLGANPSLSGIGRDITMPFGFDLSTTSAWAIETGLRYFYSSGRFRLVLGAPGNADIVNSRLTYGGIAAHAAEAFTRIEHVGSRLFLKASLGKGGVDAGTLRDEDFPRGAPYSNTISEVQNGDIAYATLDAGYDALRTARFSLGGFLGYHYASEVAHAYGCAQTANGGFCRPAISSSLETLSQDAQWNAMRIGLTGTARFGRLELSGDVAFLPLVSLDGYDHHWLRPEINAMAESGSGIGYQAETTLSYDVTQHVSLGIGARYSRLDASGSVQFPGFAPSPSTFETQRYGGFLQAAYRFGD